MLGKLVNRRYVRPLSVRLGGDVLVFISDINGCWGVS